MLGQLGYTGVLPQLVGKSLTPDRNNMKVSLKSKNHQRNHDFVVTVRPNELLLTTSDGREIASITVDTGEREIKQKDGTWATTPSEDFFVQFNPVNTDVGKDAIWVAAEPEKAK